MSLFTSAQTSRGIFSPSLLTSLMEDIVVPGLIDPDQIRSYISDESTQHTARSNNCNYFTWSPIQEK